ncbi:MAG: SgcJ/EcaC family oxidoreductase [Cytophagales bacterium]|nr:SgcJ/EcaC family oxidoreductase [Cytophagales bacterium]
MQTAWNTHDMHALANLFHEDGTWIVWDGKTVWKGRALIEEGHAKAHKTVYRNTVQTKQIEEISFVGPDAAVVRTHDTLTGDERYPDKVVESRKFLVCTRKNNVWKIWWGQNTRHPEFTTKK